MLELNDIHGEEITELFSRALRGSVRTGCHEAGEVQFHGSGFKSRLGMQCTIYLADHLLIWVVNHVGIWRNLQKVNW